MTEEKLVRIGLIGLGGVCEAVHYPGYARIPGVQITALCDPDTRLLQKRRDEWSVAACFTDADGILNDGEIDAVVIATPNNLHRDLILQSLASGRHVLCEKPIGMSVNETEEVYEAARASGLRHMTAFTYRFAPAMTYIRHLVTTGELGEIRHARFQRFQDWGEDSIGWRQYRAQAGSGELGDMGIHRIDFAEQLLGRITSVCGAAKQLVPRERTASGEPCPTQDVEDWVAWIAHFDSGATGVFEMGKLTKGHGPEGDHDLAELNGTKASAVYRLHAPHEILYGARQESYEVRPLPEPFLKRAGSPRDPEEGDPVWTFRYDQAWEFVSAIREERDAVPSFYDGMRAQIVAEAILQSHEERRWVDVPAM